MPEKSAFFKKYKIKIEAYLTAQGYDVKQSYKDFVAKQKAELADKNTPGRHRRTYPAVGDDNEIMAGRIFNGRPQVATAIIPGTFPRSNVPSQLWTETESRFH